MRLLKKMFEKTKNKKRSEIDDFEKKICNCCAFTRMQLRRGQQQRLQQQQQRLQQNQWLQQQQQLQQHLHKRQQVFPVF